MLTNYHTHTDFCDGANSAEEMVVKAIELGFNALGFSGHGYAQMTQGYCIKDVGEYIAEIKRLKEKYANKIQIYLGVEEDAPECVNRADFDYIIGALHHVFKDGKALPVDHSKKDFIQTLKAFNNDHIAFTKAYYEFYVDYLLKRKPDIVAHFDLLTKFDELDKSLFLQDNEYNKIAEKYLLKALDCQSIFEVNTGAIARGYRTSPYPALNLLNLIKKNDGKVMITTDCHNKDKLDCYIREAKALLKDVGFKYTYVLYDGEFKKDYL